MKRKCKTCGDSRLVQCSACKRAGFVSQACIHCGGLGTEACPKCTKKCC